MEPSCSHHLSILFMSAALPAAWCPGKRRTRRKRAGDKMPSKRTAGKCVFPYHGTSRAISTARLNTSPCLHLRPIYVVVSDGPKSRSNLGAGFVLRCLQHLSFPDAATRPCPLAGQPAYRRSVRHGPLVLVPGLLKSQRPQQIETELSHDVLNPARVPL